VPAVPDRHHEVLADEHHDLAGVDHLARRRQLFVLHVADRLEDREQRLAITLHLRALVRLHRVLHSQGVQVEELGDALELGGRRFVQPQPDEAVALLADPLDRLHQIRAGRGADTLPVAHAVHHGRTQWGARVMAQIDLGAPPGQLRHPPQAAYPAQAGDLPQIPRHGHVDLLADSPWTALSRLASQCASSTQGRGKPVDNSDSASFPPVDNPVPRAREAMRGADSGRVAHIREPG